MEQGRVFNTSLFFTLVFPVLSHLLTQPKKATDTMGMITKKKMSGNKFLNGRKKIF